MKKYLFFLLTLVVASFAFISCSSDDDDNGDYDKSMIVGTWEMTAVKTSELLRLRIFRNWSRNMVFERKHTEYIC